jgi:methyl-accepting chemotaxis protein
MDHHLEVWVTVVAAAATLAVLIQLGFLVALLFGMQRLRAKIKETQAAASSRGPNLRELATTAKETLDSINRVARNTAELTERIKTVADDASEVSRRQLARADKVVGDVLTRVERVSDHVEDSILKPVREIQAVVAAIRYTLAVFFRYPNSSKKASLITVTPNSPLGHSCSRGKVDQ